MKRGRPKLLILTSSFPADPGDETCGYIRDFARSLAGDFDVEVLAPAGARAMGPVEPFKLACSRPLMPRSWNGFLAGSDLGDALNRGLLVKLATSISIMVFFFKAMWLARKVDGVCSHWMVPCGLIGAVVTRIYSIPHTVVEHSGALHLLSRMRGGRLMARFITRRSREVVTVSNDLQRKLVALCPEAEGRSVAIPMGLNLAPLSHPRTEAGIVLFIGRLTQIKGVQTLLRAMPGVEDARLVIAGDGEMKEALRLEAERLSVNCTFLGRVDAKERTRLLAAARVLVIPSLVLSGGRSEGMPVVCLEAMAAGVPVIASRSGGLPEVISDEGNGLIFEPGDHDALAGRLRQVLGDAALWRSLSEAGLKTARQYDWSIIGARHGEVIKRALKSNGRSVYIQGTEAGAGR